MSNNNLTREDKIKLLEEIRSGQESISVLDEKETLGMIIQVSEDPEIYDRKGKLYTREELEKQFGTFNTDGSKGGKIIGMIIL